MEKSRRISAPKDPFKFQWVTKNSYYMQEIILKVK